ncbi:unnamed protein product [Urochloa decumbens]|uniref:PGG domain-containing protein n=1 Tax=Urochloa decumbens TaxID=240449 RepID=A0ABC8W5E6_9POAL
MASTQSDDEPSEWEYSLRKYLLMLATVMATVTYSAGFNPPGGVWQDTDAAAGHLAGDPIIRATSYRRYMVFFYCNATAFASSLLVIVLFLILAILHEQKKVWIRLKPLRALMALDLLGLVGAYAAGTCQDTFTTVYCSVLVGTALTYIGVHRALASCRDQLDGRSGGDLELEEGRRKALVVLATFVVSVTYASGLSTPGGFWDTTEEGHRLGDAILMDKHKARLRAFFVCNTTALIASLLILVLLLSRKLHLRAASYEMYGCILVALVSLVGAFAAGSSRGAGATAFVVVLVVAAGLVRIMWRQVNFSEVIRRWWAWQPTGGLSAAAYREEEVVAIKSARSLLLLLATFATAITYQAGLHPPGGLWQDSRDGHLAGDPILLTTQARRYKTFFYCNSIAFVASLAIVVLSLENWLIRFNVVTAAVMLELFGLVGAYAAGSCRDVSTSVDVMAMAAAVRVYVVVHVIFFPPLDHREEDSRIYEKDLKIRKLLYLLATLVTTLTYQTGLTPPSGSWPSGNHAGDPVLLYNYPRRYKVFFYCNSLTLALSVAIMVLLVNRHLYTPAIRSHALSVCMVAGLLAVMGAYAAGSSQHLTTSIGVFVVVALVLIILVPLFVLKPTSMLLNLRNRMDTDVDQQLVQVTGQRDVPRTKHRLLATRKYLMLLGVLVASITYQAGLDPPGGLWQHGSDGHDAGNPVMHDSRRTQYLAFFCSNSTSFGASVISIIVLLFQWFQKDERGSRFQRRLMYTIIELDLLALLVAYATGSSFGNWKPWLYMAIGTISFLAYCAINVMLRTCRRSRALLAREPGLSGEPSA